MVVFREKAFDERREERPKLDVPRRFLRSKTHEIGVFSPSSSSNPAAPAACEEAKRTKRRKSDGKGETVSVRSDNVSVVSSENGSRCPSRFELDRREAQRRYEERRRKTQERFLAARQRRLETMSPVERALRDSLAAVCAVCDLRLDVDDDALRCRGHTCRRAAHAHCAFKDLPADKPNDLRYRCTHCSDKLYHPLDPHPPKLCRSFLLALADDPPT